MRLRKPRDTKPQMPGTSIQKRSAGLTSRVVAPAVAFGALTPLSVQMHEALEGATREVMYTSDLATCFEVAYASEDRRQRFAQNVVQRWRETWTRQMESVLAGGPWPARNRCDPAFDGPTWFQGVMGAANGQPKDAAVVLRFVVEQMPSRVVDACAAIRKQSEE